MEMLPNFKAEVIKYGMCISGWAKYDCTNIAMIHRVCGSFVGLDMLAKLGTLSTHEIISTCSTVHNGSGSEGA